MFDEDEWERYIMSRVHDEFMWLDRPYKITKHVVHVVTCLHQTSRKPNLRKVTNPTVIKLTGAQYDNKSMTIDDILENEVKFSSMIIGYKVYQSSRLNSVSGTAIYASYQMVKEDMQYDLCIVLLEELLRNLKKIKLDKNNVFKFGSLIVYLALYFMDEIPGIGRAQWAFDLPVSTQIKQGLQRLGNKENQTASLWSFFKTFQGRMKNRERIPKEVVVKYANTICFMVDRDQCNTEVVEPRTVWIMPMCYEVDAQTLEG